MSIRKAAVVVVLVVLTVTVVTTIAIYALWSGGEDPPSTSQSLTVRR